MPKHTFQTLYKLLSLFILIAVSGCAGVPSRFYIPKAQPISAKAVLNPEFKVYKYVNLMNAQTDDDDVFIGAYTHEWWANYQRWTDAAIELLQTELQKRGNIVHCNAATVFALGICADDANGRIMATLHTDLKKTGCPLDTDQDGAPDANDQCPGTPVVEKSDCEASYFSIAGQDPPDAAIQLIKSELRKEDIILTETGSNVFSFSATAEKWEKAHRRKLQEALENRDLLMLEGPPQILQLSVNHVHLFWNFHDVGCTLNLRVQTLQEQVRNFEATNISPELYVACDWAMSKAVTGMFVDHAMKDSDGDGVFDPQDNCPDTPKGVEVDERGCPLDTDGDGVPDYMDECPGTPKGAKVDEKGCPLDTDGDGVPDYKDECPGTPKGARVDERGCWVISEALFDFNKYQIKTKYYPHLDEIVTVLQTNPSMAIEIQGHTDNAGTNRYNRKLSENRAKAVKNYLTKKGVNEQRLIAVGFGFSRPKTTNRTKEGRALNRRVELLPVQQ